MTLTLINNYLEESTYAIATYETFPHKTKLLNEEIFNKFGNNFYFRDAIKSCLNIKNYKNFILLTPDESDWIAYLTYDPINRILYNFEVNPKYRGQGVGKYILSKIPIEYLYVLHNNIPAIKLYEKCGFKKVPQIVVYSNFHKEPDNILMYNTKLVKSLFRKEKGNLYFNIGIPKEVVLVLRNAILIDKLKNQIHKQSKIIPLLKHSDKPNVSISNTYSTNNTGQNILKKYLVFNNINKNTPLSLNHNKILSECPDFVLHESWLIKNKYYNINVNKNQIKKDFNKIKSKGQQLYNQQIKKIHNVKQNLSKYSFNDLVNEIKKQLTIIKRNELYHFNKNLKPYLIKAIQNKYKFKTNDLNKMLIIYKNINVFAKSLNYLNRIKNKSINLCKEPDKIKIYIENKISDIQNKINSYGDKIKQIKAGYNSKSANKNKKGVTKQNATNKYK